VFKLGVRKRKLPASPHIETLDESGNVREGFLEPPEFEAVCALLPDYLQDATRFAYLTGWRVGAIRALEWRDVDLRARTLLLRAAHAKNKRAKLLPLTAALLDLIERRVAARDLACPFVFPGAAGGRLGDFRKAWKRACATAGERGVVFHDLRRSGARNAVRAGVPEQVVMELGGWRTRAVFGRYNITSERDLADAIERVSGYVAERAADAPKIRPIHGEPAQNPHNRASGGSSRKAGTRVTVDFLSGGALDRTGDLGIMRPFHGIASASHAHVASGISAPYGRRAEIELGMAAENSRPIPAPWIC